MKGIGFAAAMTLLSIGCAMPTEPVPACHGGDSWSLRQLERESPGHVPGPYSPRDVDERLGREWRRGFGARLRRHGCRVAHVSGWVEW